MRIPGFSAELTLKPATSIYRARIGTRPLRGGVLMQQFFTSSLLGRLGFSMTCCGYSKIYKRFICTTQPVSPFENCRCETDYFGHPLILCKPPVIGRF